MFIDDKPYLGTYTPQSYYNVMLQVDPYNAEQITKKACLNSGTSINNPAIIDQFKKGFDNVNTNDYQFNFKPLQEEEKKPYYDYQFEFEKKRQEYKIKAENEQFKKSIWYKLHVFFGGE